ncbi:diguanylate cyclase domain-containing protein [Ureibacillus aquaedulcis]|uniref:Diguanylate cyclase n=1 Tax=Ureibacillus aquaedulcis TaxID=3058421 RepID=A0ABT8GP61_9BACL|nr:diguanylate cyclase [Ureibacillus sp. BA0131]MDN4493203.1 diguanylate cyclase [Ureibacillus sp. BA0131]
MKFKPIFFLLLYILVYYNLLFYFENRSTLLSTVSNLLLTIASLITVTILFKAFINQNNQHKKFTLLLFLACICYSLGNLYWTYFEYVHGIPPNVSIYDILLLLTYIFFLCAFIYYFKSHKVVLVSTYLFDILVFIVITATLAWVFIMRPFLSPNFNEHSLLRLVTNLGYPIADLTILFACLLLFLYTSLSKSLLYIIFGLIINIVANSINFYQSTYHSYLFDHFIDPLWALSILLVGFSGLGNFEEKKVHRTYFKRYIQLFIPYTIMIIFLFMVFINSYDVKDPLFIGVFLSIVLLMIRLFITINRNEKLNNAVNQKNRQLKEANDKLRFLAYHDELTKLPNRHFLFEKMQKEIFDNDHQNQSQFSLLFIDLDGFKYVNDTFGHNVGDTLLKEVSGRLREELAEGDFVCRFAGDEFILLLTGRDKNEVEIIAAAIVESLSKQYSIDSHEIFISSSIGISYIEEHDNILSVINRADQAMYNIKKNGKNGFSFT